MPVTQLIQSVIQGSSGGGGPLPPGNNAFGYFVSPPNLIHNVSGIIGTGNTNATLNSSYTFPDNSTGSVLEFNGIQSYSTPNLAIGGAWQNAGAGAVNIWFYPTAYDIQIISECDREDVVSGYHYSMLEVTNTGNIRACYYNGPYITSDNTITLNSWNHVYWAIDWNGGKYLSVNGVNTNSQNYTPHSPPGTSAVYFNIGMADVTNGGSAYSYQGKLAMLEVADFVEGSNFESYRAKFGL